MGSGGDTRVAKDHGTAVEMAALMAGAGGRGCLSQAGDLSKPRLFSGRDLDLGGFEGEGERG